MQRFHWGRPARACLGLAGALALCLGCNGSQSAPASISGTWVFQVLSEGCDGLAGGVLHPGDGTPTLFQVSRESTQQFAAQFIDDGGATCSLDATYVGDQVRGSIEMNGTSRIVQATFQGFARRRNGETFVDGWARIEADTSRLCIGEIVEFCAEVIPDGAPVPEPEPEPEPEPQTCPPADLVFLVDTVSTNSTVDALCTELPTLPAAIEALGFTGLRITVLGVNENEPDDELPSAYDCVNEDAADLLGTRLPPDGLQEIDHPSDWGPGITVVADRFAWNAGQFRILVPITAQGPENGGFSSDTADLEAINKAIQFANAKGVIVSPIMTDDGQPASTTDLGDLVASGTGGIFQQIQTPSVQLRTAILALLANACELRDVPENVPPSQEPPPPVLGDEEVIAQCPDVDVVFLVDTSASMIDDFFLLCGGDLNTILVDPLPQSVVIEGALTRTVNRLNALGGNVQARILGITETGAEAASRIAAEQATSTAGTIPSDIFDCVLEKVTTELTNDVPIHPSITGEILIDDPIDARAAQGFHSYESWGSATAIVAAADAVDDSFWRPGAVRIVIPISDEGPELGLGPDSGQEGDCNDADVQSVDNAIAVALDNAVIVTPIAAFLRNSTVTGHHPCLTTAEGTGEMDRLAAATGGLVGLKLSELTSIDLQDPQGLTQELEDVLFDLVVGACRETIGAEEPPP